MPEFGNIYKWRFQRDRMGVKEVCAQYNVDGSAEEGAGG